MVSHCVCPTRAGSSGLSRLSGLSGWSDRKFIKKNQTDQKDQPTRQTNPGALREHRRDSVQAHVLPHSPTKRSGPGWPSLRASNEINVPSKLARYLSGMEAE